MPKPRTVRKVRKVDHLVVDTSAFFRNADISRVSENIYAPPSIVGELKDYEVRRRMQFLPYKINFREPSPQSLKFVSRFAKKTGEYSTLSAVDLSVLALAYQLECEKVGKGHINSEPEKKISWKTTKASIERTAKISGFVWVRDRKTHSDDDDEEDDDNCAEQERIMQPPQECAEQIADSEQPSTSTSNVTDTPPINEETAMDEEEIEQMAEKVLEAVEIEEAKFENKEMAAETKDSPKDSSDGTKDEDSYGEDDEDSYGEDDDDFEDSYEDDDEEELKDDGDDDGWINPSNLHVAKHHMRQLNPVEFDNSTEPLKTACLTSDFAMQNVLLQMGLNVVSVKGFLIKNTKQVVLFCSACYEYSCKRNVRFCPECGIDSLERVFVTHRKDGSVKLVAPMRHETARGKRFPLPAFKGGKHSRNPIVCADQRQPQQKLSKKALQKCDVFELDYTANPSPFTTNDVYSRSSILGYGRNRNNFHSRNPHLPLPKGKKKR